MVDFFNAETGLPEQLNDDVLEDAFLSGTHNLAKDTDINLVAPNGETIIAKSNEAANLIRSGFRFERAEEAALREYRADQQDSGIVGSISAFGKQAVNQALLGLPDFVAEQKSSELENEKRKIEKEENPVANMFGGLTGFGLSILYGGPIWKGVGYAGTKASALALQAAKALGPRAAESIAAKAGALVAKGATEGALISAPHAIAEATLGDPESVAEGLLSGAGVGAALETGLGVMGGALSGAFRLASQTLTPDKINALADRLTLKGQEYRSTQFARAAELAKKDVAKGNREAVEFAESMGLTGLKAAGKSPAERVEIITQRAKELDTEFNGIRAAVDKEFPSSVSMGDVFQSIDDAIKGHDDTLGRRNGSWKDAKDVKGVLQDKTQKILKGELVASNGVLQKVSGPIGSSGKAATSLEETWQKAMGPIVPTGRTALTLEESWALRNLIKNEFKISSGDASKGAIDAFNSLDQKILSVLDQIEKEGGGTLKDQVVAYRKARQKIYQYLPSYQEIAKRTQGNNLIGPTDYGAGMTGAILGDIPGAIAGMGINYLKRNYSNQLLASTLYKAAETLDAVQTGAFQAIDRALGIAKSQAPKVKIASINLLNQYAETDDKKKAFRELSRDLSAFQNDPKKAADILSGLTAQFANEAPMIQQAMLAKINQAASYLAQEMPKPDAAPDPMNPQPFIPSDRQLSQFERKMQAAFNPMSVLSEIERGTLTREHVDALEKLYPKFLDAIRLRVQERIPLAAGRISQKSQGSLRILLNSQLITDKAGSSIKMLQDNFESQPKPKPRANSKITEASRTASDIDRIVYE